MKRITRKYAYDGNILHLIIGSFVFAMRLTWKIAMTFLADIERGIAGVAIMVLAIILLIGLIVYAPIRPIVWFMKALWVLKLRKMATPENLPPGKLLWQADKGGSVFQWDSSQTTNLEAGLYFIPNRRDLIKYHNAARTEADS